MVKPTDSFVVSQVRTLRDQGLTFSAIAEQLNLRNRHTAMSAYCRFQRNHSYLPKKPPGRPEKLSQREQRQFASIARKSPFFSRANIQSL